MAVETSRMTIGGKPVTDYAETRPSGWSSPAAPATPSRLG